MREDLPSTDVKRWTPRRKAQVIDAVARGDLTTEIACERYRISRAEFLAWERLEHQFGMAGLQTTRTKDYLTSIRG
ncbi:DUF1153 domain-containing protein [Aurantimonas sp. A2-1-M11]|uniref:DUF1153 domain-containing protein n=1 Tax=Aurantimonas sp. A2-1-M11 TaxID=3113712 RepID=UPI002F953B42